MADSNLTKRALAAALKELMQTRPFSGISVSSICAHCGMNRKSFYYHFKDKYDLVNWIFDTEFLSSAVGASRDGREIVRDLCRYFYENRVFYRKALQVEGQNSFSDHFRDLLIPLIRHDLSDALGRQAVTPFCIDFFADACIGSIRRWLLDKECMPPEEFISQLQACLAYLSCRYNP